MAPIQKSRRVISVVLTSWLLGVIAFGMFVTARPAFAEGEAASTPVVAVVKFASKSCKGMNTAATPDTCVGISDGAEEVDNSIIKPAMQIAIISALMNLVQFALDRVAYEAATWIAAGAPGGVSQIYSKDAVHAYGEFGLDVVGEAIGGLSDVIGQALDGEFDLCAPANPLFELGLQLGLKQAYQPKAPKCDFRDVMSNWDSFISTTVATASNPSQVVLKAFADGFKPGQNELSASVKLNIEVNQRVLEKKKNLLADMLANKGFKNVADVITGQVKTPSSVLEQQFNEEITNTKKDKVQMNMQAFFANTDLVGPMFLQVAGVFTNTLLSSLMNKVYTGLFEVQPTDDPFDAELAEVASRDDVAKQFSSLITSHPSQISNYNVLNEFVTCPSSGLGVRNLTQCVMDQNFMTAVMRAESGTPLTVQQAIDEGLLNGSWTLIPNEGEGMVSNQDLNCYTYGYCYSNLVKMRKARVIPVGWEIAASLNATGPQTLQEIIDGFNSSDSDWYHLIDPNWVLKYPQTQCKAYVNGDVQISTMAAGRAGACVDTPSCIAEDNDGNCTAGYGYCTQEKNVWKFKGTECPAEAASCMIFNNVDGNAKADFLLNTVDFANCDADNAGCLWYRTNKYADDAATPDDTSDDTFEWIATGDDFVTADREDDVRKATAGAMVSASSYSYDTDGGTDGDFTYANYAYEDRIYYNNNIDFCDASAAGCNAVYKINGELVLNLVQNPSVEVPEGDSDDLPDNWSGVTDANLSATEAYYGNNSVFVSSTSDDPTQENVRLAANSFYTLSFYASGTDSTDDASVKIGFSAADGSLVDLRGTSSAGDCVLGASNDSYTAALSDVPAGTAEDRTWTQYSCTFTTMSAPLNATISMEYDFGTAVYFDSIQLELGEDASSFTEGYSDSSPAASYLLVAPSYLNCTGEATDAAECASYAQMCTAQDVGCNLYTPEDGDPAVPAIAEALDECPSECVGYASYKQEATDRQVESFPLYFIADAATACPAESVGCDAFTNLDATDAGGEGTEYYSDVRACLKTAMTDSTDGSGKESGTWFTWEGSDAAGYQLVTWTLLKSNLTRSNAPCSTWSVESESEVVCAETGAFSEPDECDEHDDIFSNPDCREFYDELGDIHYREYSSTVSISDDCHPYRFTSGDSADCAANGGYWTAVGDCRYFGLPDESTECSAAAAGCRSYTGGGGRNASVVYSDEFEDGALTEYKVDTGTGSPEISVSNESVATGGHSMRAEVTSASGRSVTTTMNYLDWANKSLTYDPDDSADTCSSIDATSGPDGGASRTVTSDGCVIDYGSGNPCTVEEGDNNCGTLDDVLVDGKTYQLSFWAKGSDSIRVTLVEEGGGGDTHDFVDPTDDEGDNDLLALEGGWHEYVLGPVDTSSFDAFDDSAIISFSSSLDSIFYIDNIRLKELEDNVTLIQDSWVVPSTCDSTPSGASSPQYYLGCKAYTDQDGADANLYQFSDLCSEEVVGCEAAYNTYNSDDAFAMTYNARCVNDADADGEADVVPSNTDCILDEVTACTIGVGDTYCLFDRSGSLPSIFPYAGDANGNDFSLELGPEAVAVNGDSPMYIVDNGSATCTFDNVGCQEIGLPTYDQAKENVTSFESTYVINDPDNYSDVLCENQSLFCAEWTSTQDGNFYFKDPGDQTCEYQTNVTVDGATYDGWFKTDTTEACDVDYVKGGSEYGIWRNGDDDYSNWVGTCTDAYDLCTEFLDVSDTSDGNYTDGTPYNFINDDSLLDESLTATDQCGGQISQKFGCALFNDTTDSTTSYSTMPSYIASTHADTLFGAAVASKVDPISCEDGGVGNEITTTEGDVINLCNMRCKYVLPTDSTLTVGNSVASSDGTAEYAGACLVDSDCPAMDADDSIAYSGTCETIDPAVDPSAVFDNDANRVVKVYRDRECAQWTMCGQSRVSWNTSTSMYDSICEQIVLCDQTSASGDQTACTSFPNESAVPLTSVSYSTRDVTWSGNEFSGYTIPGMVPVEHLSEVNIQPETEEEICFTTDDAGVRVPMLETDGTFIPCDATDTVSDCTDVSWDIEADYCFSASPSLRLAHVAGSCDQSAGWGSDCTIGYCEDDAAQTCQQSSQCGTDADGAEVDCVIGFCQLQDSSAPCLSDSDCTDTTSATYPGVNYPVCDAVYGFCVNDVTPSEDGCFDVSDCSGTGAVCRPSADAFDGICLNDQCVVGSDGEPLILGVDDMDHTLVSTQNAEESTCRGYPEVTSPFSPFSSEDNEPGIVEDWVYYDSVEDPADMWTVTGTSIPSASMVRAYDATDYKDAVPYTYVSGFQGQNVCAPNPSAAIRESFLTSDCDCSYTKVSYGTGLNNRFYSTTNATNAPSALCVGGSANGMQCTTDAECGSGASCTQKSRSDSYNGWQGYCLERDMSINLYGNADEHPCITWLPVDALAGATDLYGKSTEAGFPLENEYYCTETGYYVDLYPTGAMDEDDDGAMDTIDYACATSWDYGLTETEDFRKQRNSGGLDAPTGLGDGSIHCSYGQYDGCEANVTCPEGYIGVVGYCNQNFDGTVPTDAGTKGDVCTDDESEGTDNKTKKTSSVPDLDVNKLIWRDAASDCPYFCVPSNSQHAQSTYLSQGESCDDEITGSGSLFSKYGTNDINGISTTVYYGGNLFIPYWEDPSDSSSFHSTLQHFSDCAVRGIPYVAESVTVGDATYDLDWAHTDLFNDDGVFATGLNLPDDATEESGGYAFVFNLDTYQFAYGIANRAVGAKIGICENTSQYCDDSADCEVTSWCDTLCTLFTGGEAISLAICDTFCDAITPDPVCGGISSSDNVSGNIHPYLGCYEVSQTAADNTDPSLENGGTYNKAWTNRLMYSSSSFENQGQFPYTKDTAPQYAGALPFDAFYEWNGDESAKTFNDQALTEVDVEDQDAFPLPIQACDNTSETSGLVGITTNEDSETCEVGEYGYPGELFGDENLGRAYEDVDSNDDELDAIDGERTVDDTAEAGSNDGQAGILQFFEYVIRTFTFDYQNGEYDLVAGSFDDTSVTYAGTVDAVGDEYGSGSDEDLGDGNRAPTVRSVDECEGTYCTEGADGTISVNSLSEGIVYGSAGQAYTSVSFFAYANPNQMPIRNINVDWGDDRAAYVSGAADWPTGSQGGSTTDDNFYKNYRGTDSNDVDMCNDSDWGTSSSGCRQGYVTFTNSYTCTTTDVQNLNNTGRICAITVLPDGTEVLQKSPCVDTSGVIPDNDAGGASCVFQPRVSVLDNWGWCTGTCGSETTGGSDGTSECYQGIGDENECDISNCPGNTTCGIGGTINPWINFNGYVIVTPP